MRHSAGRISSHLRQFGLVSLSKTALSRAWRPARHGLEKVWFHVRTLPLRRVRRASVPQEYGDFVISLTTYPQRVRHVWATVETLLRQTIAPSAVVLVLAEDEFTTRSIPRSLRRRVRRGLRVLWIPQSLGSYGKYLPARRAYPSSVIITVDDDVLYDRDLAERLLAVASSNPESIVGHRGWLPQRRPQPDAADTTAHGGFERYRAWMRHPAGPQADPDEVFLTGVGGILYPGIPDFDAVALQDDVARELAPTADDVWFWGAAVWTSTPRYCTGESFGVENGLERHSPSLNATNVFGNSNDRAVDAVARHFGLRF